MSRKSLLLALGILLLLAGGSTATLFVLVGYVPSGYKEAAVPPGPERIRSSKEFTAEVAQLLNATRSGQEREWQVKLTEKQINSFFAEDFVKSGLDERLLPNTIADPRIILDNDRVRLAFRYRKGVWSSVISLDFRLWLPKQGEPNVLCMELQNLQAGRLPINAQSLLQEITNATRDHGIEVKWYRYEGNPVAMIRFQADKPQTTLKLEHVHVSDGAMIIQGKPFDRNTRVAAVKPKPSNVR